MLHAPRTVSIRVPDVGAARQWYGAALARDPVFESPFAAAFDLDGCTLLLLAREGQSQAAVGTEPGGVVFFGVDDIEAAYRHLLGCGATACSEITFTLLRTRMARLADPFGNRFGIVSAAERPKAVDARPSESAMTVAFSRALAAHDDREGLRGPDGLAEVFLNEEGRKPLADRAAREWIIAKMAGSHEYFLARTRYLDEAFAAALDRRVPQIVFLGAGYDSRACRFASQIHETTRIYELDVEPTQARKRLMLEKAGVIPPPQLAYLIVNFATDALVEALPRAGFDPAAPALFVWEGVTYYLSAAAVEETLTSVRRLAAAGSRLVFDYLLQAADLDTRPGVKEVLEAWRNAYAGEPVQFGVAEGKINDFLAERGFRVLEQLGPEDQERRFLARADGSLAGRVVPMFGIVTAETET